MHSGEADSWWHAEDAEYSAIKTHVSRGFSGTRCDRMYYPVNVTDGRRNSPINRRMSATRFLGMATSAIWNATLPPLAHNLRANIDELLLEARQRPVFDGLGHGERAQKVAGGAICASTPWPWLSGTSPRGRQIARSHELGERLELPRPVGHAASLDTF
jgi:hypothetical protein